MGVSSQYVASSASIADGAVSEAKLAGEAVSVAKMKKEGTAGWVLTANGVGNAPAYAATGAVATGWVLKETITVAASAQTKDTSVAIAGETDKAYMILYRMVNDNAANATYNLRINGASITGTRQHLRMEGATATSATSGTITFGADSVQNGAQSGIIYIPCSKKDFPRHVHQQTTAALGGTDGALSSILLTAPTTATAITSLGIGSDKATGIGVGSQILFFSL